MNFQIKAVRIEYNKPNFSSKVEQNLMKQLISMEQLITSTSNLFLRWINSGDDVT